MPGLKECPRCKGSIFIDRDHLGWYEQCLQCGYQRDLPTPEEATGHGHKLLKHKRDKARSMAGVTK
jgi:hypothetical protein